MYYASNTLSCTLLLKFSSFECSQLNKLMNEGKLLPDDVILELLAKRLETGSATGESGFILDGFPRTQSQAVST